MLRLAKWAYDLGVRQERVRIASHLQVHAQGARVSNNAMDNMFREEATKKRPNKGKLSQIEFDRAVQSRVEIIIEDIFNPKGDWVPGASIMFPDDDHKGKVK